MGKHNIHKKRGSYYYILKLVVILTNLGDQRFVDITPPSQNINQLHHSIGTAFLNIRMF
jgi:hypothetical protein